MYMCIYMCVCVCMYILILVLYLFDDSNNVRKIQLVQFVWYFFIYKLGSGKKNSIKKKD